MFGMHCFDFHIMQEYKRKSNRGKTVSVRGASKPVFTSLFLPLHMYPTIIEGKKLA